MQEMLAARLHFAGWIISRSGVSKIENGKLKACRALRGKLLVSRTELLKLLKTDSQ